MVYKIEVEQNTKQFYCIADKKLSNFLKITPLARPLTAESYGYGVYSCACIYQLNVEDFVVEIHHGDILYF